MKRSQTAHLVQPVSVGFMLLNLMNSVVFSGVYVAQSEEFCRL
jgi:hypothetical protein